SIMKKHLTLPPPSFQSKGVSVPPAIEAVVRHCLEKEVSARIESIPAFLRELHAALNSSPVVASALRETVSMDPNRTMAAAPTTPIKEVPNLSATATQPPGAQDTNFGTSFGSIAGAVSDTQLDKDVKEQERNRREQEQQEKFERMALQAKELEDRLERLSGSMPPALDPEATHVQSSATSPELAGGVSVGPRKPMIVEFGAKRKGPPALLFIGAAVAVLVLAGLGISAYLVYRSQSNPVNPGPTPTPVVPAKTKADLVAIEGGSFLMGRETGPPQETPAHPVIVQQFLMDRTEVTNTEYAEFVNEGKHAKPSHWPGTRPPFGQELWPVVNVSFDDVNAFAAWRSKRDGVSYRLPTEQEWEYAARNGERSDLYPWGSDWRDNFAVLQEATPAPVGSRPDGKNRWGVFDLIGNVWEWTSSRVSAYPGNRTEVPASTQDWVTIRGGCYVSDPGKSDAPVSSCMREFVPPSTRTTLLGFRLVRDGP
ncbi:MAG TPA: SUMF1/EgtB/PvdO family nonheme iron enzyme, partial [Pyrinomonadaceae bacterium]|nr:SUMF1/EgtB/PvdO family nonheme iron enzyme [Pyrinomonadaceae bacterium]